MVEVPAPLAIRYSQFDKSGVPRLHVGLPRDPAAGRLDHGGAEYARAVRVGAGLGEGEAAAVGYAVLDLVGHGTAAHVVIERGDCRAAFELARAARRVVAVDDPHHRIV